MVKALQLIRLKPFFKHWKIFGIIIDRQKIISIKKGFEIKLLLIINIFNILFIYTVNIRDTEEEMKYHIKTNKQLI